MKKQYIVLLSGILLILTCALGGYFYKNQQSKKISFMAKENASTFVREYSPTLGNDDAKVYIVEFLDPACETCSAFYPYVKNLMGANPGKIKLVIRYAPFHDGSDYFVKIIEQDLADAKALNVRKTPEFFVNGKPLPSFGYDQLKALVEAEIKANY